jgi:hypothetical protein
MADYHGDREASETRLMDSTFSATLSVLEPFLGSCYQDTLFPLWKCIARHYGNAKCGTSSTTVEKTRVSRISLFLISKTCILFLSMIS